MTETDDVVDLMKRAWSTRRKSFPTSGSEKNALIKKARTDLEDAVALCRKNGTPSQLAQAIHLLANVEHDLGHNSTAEALWEEAVTVCRTVGEPLHLAHKIRHLGDLRKYLGRFEQAEACYEEALNLYRTHEDPPKLDFANAICAYAHLMEVTNSPQESLML